jgi:hypothetical protein
LPPIGVSEMVFHVKRCWVLAGFSNLATMKNQESSAYVKAWAKSISKHLAQKGWVIVAGQNNIILIYANAKKQFLYTDDELMDIIYAVELVAPATGLRMSLVQYLFYHKGKLVNSATVLPGKEYDL